MGKCKKVITKLRIIINILLLKLALKFFKSKTLTRWIPEEDRQYWIDRIETLFGFIIALKAETEERE